MPDDKVALAKDFERAMYEEVYLRIWKECGYRAERFRQMIQPPKRGRLGRLYRGGVETARHLLAKPTGGFRILDKRNRLDLSVEILVLKQKWAGLFTEDELRLAVLKLEERKRARAAKV
jgi:hypothetical protein